LHTAKSVKPYAAVLKHFHRIAIFLTFLQLDVTSIRVLNINDCRDLTATKWTIMEYKTLHFELTDRIGIITLNRPEVLNALNKQFFSDLSTLLDKLDTDPVVLIITGTGKAFAAGADIKEMSEMSVEQAKAYSMKGQDTFRRLEDWKYPVIAAVNGYALGGGCELCLACDIRLASEKAKFGQPEVSLGLIPGFGATHRLSRLTGMGQALYMLTTGIQVDADAALRSGLVQELTGTDDLLPRAMEIATIMNRAGSDSLQLVKSIARASAALPPPEGMNLERDNFSSLFGGQAEEGMRAFIEKRKPSW
jgi:enoyl-CoA hydratase